MAIYYKFGLIVLNKPEEYSIFLDQIPSWSEYLAIIYGFVVIGYLLLYIRNSEKIKVFSPSEIQPQLRWFKIILVVQFFSTLLWMASEIAFGDGYESSYYYPLWIVLAIIIYWMGHTGIYKYGIQTERKAIRKATKEIGPKITIEKSKNEHMVQIDQILVQEKNFLDSNLSLESLAEKMNLSKGYLSKIINTELGKSFKEYLNQLRVEEAKSYLTNPEFSNYTLVAIGLEAGFSSKSSFNATFKKTTGMTPSQFKNQNSN